MIHISIEGQNAADVRRHLRGLLGASDETLACGSANERGETEVHSKPEFEQFGVNVYKSHQFPFALGKKVYDNAEHAKQRRTKNGNWLNSFTLEIDLETGDVKPVDFGLASQTMDRYFAIFEDEGEIHFGENGYHSANAVKNAYGSALTYIRVSADGQHVHVERA